MSDALLYIPVAAGALLALASLLWSKHLTTSLRKRLADRNAAASAIEPELDLEIPRQPGPYAFREIRMEISRSRV